MAHVTELARLPRSSQWSTLATVSRECPDSIGGALWREGELASAFRSQLRTPGGAARSIAVGAEEVKRARSSHSALGLNACCVALLILLCGLVGLYLNRGADGEPP